MSSYISVTDQFCGAGGSSIGATAAGAVTPLPLYTNMWLERSTSKTLAWTQQIVQIHHYLHKPVDSRCRPMAYLVCYQAAGPDAAAGPRCIGVLIFGRPQAVRCYTGDLTYGSLEDVVQGRAQHSYWEVLNLARVWIHPDFQRGGSHEHALPGYTDRLGHFRSVLGSHVLATALEHVRVDYLRQEPPCFTEQPYQIRACLSYCDTRIHKGTLYRTSGFTLARTNDAGIETWHRPLAALSPEHDATIRRLSQQSARARAYRSQQTYRQETLFSCEPT